MDKLKKIAIFVWDHWNSLVFSLGSIIYGSYHYLQPTILSSSGAYEQIDYFTGLIGGKYLGLLFICIGLISLYGTIVNNTRTKLSSYFALLFLWLSLTIGFLLSFIQDYNTAGWIFTGVIVLFSINIITTTKKVIK